MMIRNLLKAYVRDHGLDATANELKVSTATIRNWEGEKVSPSDTNLGKLRDLLTPDMPEPMTEPEFTPGPGMLRRIELQNLQLLDENTEILGDLKALATKVEDMASSLREALA